MKNLIFICCILIILFKTGNVLSDNKIFNVNNVEISNKTSRNKEKLVNKAFQKAFDKLINRLLLEEDYKRLSDINLIQIKKLISPNSVVILNYNNQKIEENFINSVIIFIFSYLFLFLIISILLSITGLDFLSAVSGAATSISNVGPGLGEMIGPNGNFSEVSNISKWILSFSMLLGRLEIFAVVVLFLPSFWRT